MSVDESVLLLLIISIFIFWGRPQRSLACEGSVCCPTEERKKDFVQLHYVRHQSVASKWWSMNNDLLRVIASKGCSWFQRQPYIKTKHQPTIPTKHSTKWTFGTVEFDSTWNRYKTVFVFNFVVYVIIDWQFTEWATCLHFPSWCVL